ncbi:MAG: hypothetical protein K0R18_413 [Bacillales bacterium]|nr:hypothetical protein [Bacillales bacterium]
MLKNFWKKIEGKKLTVKYADTWGDKMATTKEIQELQQEVLDYLNKKYKCEICGKKHLMPTNIYKLCENCYIKATFDIEKLIWQGEVVEISEYIEYKKIANELGREW